MRRRAARRTETAAARVAGQRGAAPAPSRAPARVRIAAVLAAFAIAAGLLTSASSARADDDFGALRSKWSQKLTGGTGFDPTVAPVAQNIAQLTSSAQSTWNSIVPAPAPTAELWADLHSATSPSDLLESYRRLNVMALAYATHGSGLEGNAGLKASTIAALDWLAANRYSATTVEDTKNWWYWEIGIPLKLNDITVLLYDSLSVDQVAASMNAVHHFLPAVSRTGANRAWAAMVIGLRGVIIGSADEIAKAQVGIVPALKYVTKSDGFYADGSFIQHTNLPYTGGYGVSMLQTTSDLLFLLAGSRWAVTDASVKNVYAWVSTSFAPLMFAGAIIEPVRGREISRSGTSDVDAGAEVIRATLVLAASAPAATAAQLRSIARGWLTGYDLTSYFVGCSVTEIAQSQALFGVDPATGGASTTTTATTATLSAPGSTIFAKMDRVVSRTPTSLFAVAMSSSRVANFESLSGENGKAWFTANGMTYLYDATRDQYDANYWATVNPYRLAGTTVDTLARVSAKGANYLSPSNYAGGASSASSLYSVSGMKLDENGTNLTANKAWFTFDDEVVAVGSGITDTGQTGVGWDKAARHVETIVDDRRLDASSQTLTVDGTTSLTTTSAAAVFTDPSWAELSGVTLPDGSTAGQIGYVFPGTEPVTIARTTNTGAWRNVNTLGGSTAVNTNEFVSLWFDEGVNPAGATYSYVLLPGASADQTAAYAATPQTVVLANTADVAAVKDTTLNAVGAMFWNAAPATVLDAGTPFITASTQSAVFTEETASGIRVSVADPTQANKQTIDVEIARGARTAVSVPKNVTVLQLTPTIKLRVNVATSAGQKSTVSFSY